VALTELLLQGFNVAGDPSQFFPPLRPDQVVVGVPASQQESSYCVPATEEPEPTHGGLLARKTGRCPFPQAAPVIVSRRPVTMSTLSEGPEQLRIQVGSRGAGNHRETTKKGTCR
jgi:hypothetical protein